MWCTEEGIGTVTLTLSGLRSNDRVRDERKGSDEQDSTRELGFSCQLAQKLLGDSEEAGRVHNGEWGKNIQRANVFIYPSITFLYHLEEEMSGAVKAMVWLWK
jgi:hypothetical protein